MDLQNKSRQDVLSILVPKFVKDYMNHGELKLNEEMKDVTILFCDIVDFDKIMNSEQERVVEMLDNLFRAYDNLCTYHGV